MTSQAEDPTPTRTPTPDDDSANSAAAPTADEATVHEAPSLSAAGVGLGIVGLIGTVAVGAGTKAQMAPSPKPMPPIKPINPTQPVQPVSPVTPMEPAEPTTPVTPVKPAEPTTPVIPIKPVEPTTPVTPIKPVEPIAPEKPIKPVLPGPGSFSVSNAHVIEDTTGTRELVFLVQRSGDLSEMGSVRFSVQVDKGSVAADDLTVVQTGIVWFNAGETQQLVFLHVNGDYLRETDEQVLVKLSDPIGGALDRAEGIGTIHEVDVTRLQAAYGMRDLNTELEGFAIRVRRSSDDAEMDIGFNAHGQLDREALLDFVGRTAADKGYVKIWYDQSGHSRHMTSEIADQQGVIVDGGKVVTRADGSAAISFNAGRNGGANDVMTAAGADGKDWRSVAIYANVQSEGTDDGTLFNLGEGDIGRMSVHYPDSGKVLFDICKYSDLRRLTWTPPGEDKLVDAPKNLVFEAHIDNLGGGTEALNHTDAKQAIFNGGHCVAASHIVCPLFRTTDTWRLAHHERTEDGDVSNLQQAMYNEFLVYLAEDNSTPSLQNLVGSAQDDVLTYSGDEELTRIDGLAGYDTLYVPGKIHLDLRGRADEIKGVEQLWLDNGQKNVLLFERQSIAAFDAKTLTIRLDSEDDVLIDGHLEAARPEQWLALLREFNPTTQFTMLIDGQPVM